MLTLAFLLVGTLLDLALGFLVLFRSYRTALRAVLAGLSGLFVAHLWFGWGAVFARENANKVPSTALWVTNGVIQLFLISTLFSRDAFTLALELTSAMALVPYLLVAAYGLLLAKRGETYDSRPEERRRDLILAGIATFYTAVMIYMGGLKFLLLSAVLYAPGTALYFWARRERNRKIFTAPEWVIFAVVVVGAVFGVYALVAGYITL